jgi:hypothetical protein
LTYLDADWCTYEHTHILRRSTFAASRGCPTST